MRTHQDIVGEIETVLKDKVAPSVAAHNGEIKFISFHKGIVRLLLAGSCSGCAMSKATLHRGVEGILKHYIPEVESIIGEDDEEAKEQFLKGATIAYEQIITSFANGDKKSLKS